jgi:pyruvate dehydrogenase E2 component (dihydrolipoamide acetyltransferase)
MLPLSLSYDHRVIDGADAARFLRWVCEVIENPMKLLVEG